MYGSLFVILASYREANVLIDIFVSLHDKPKY